MEHCRPEYFDWEKRNTCLKCAHPLLDNDLVKDAYKLNTTVGWAKDKLEILSSMAADRGLDWFSKELDKINNGLKYKL